MTRKSAKETEDQLRQENAELKARLEKAEQTLDAIRRGEEDAVVVCGPQGEQVYSLAGTEQIYRAIVETMNVAALTADPDGTILFCNQQFARLVRRPMPEAVGRKVTDFIAKAQHATLGRIMTQARTDPARGRIVMQAQDGTVTHVQVSASPLQAGGATSICLIVNDLMELEASARSAAVLRQHQQALEEAQAALRDSERFGRDVLDSLPAKIAVLDAHGVVIIANDRWPELTAGMDYLGFSRQAAQGGEAVAAEALACIESVLGGRKQEASFEYPCHTPTQQGWYVMEVTRPPVHVGGAIITHTNVTARKQAEERLRRATEELARSNRDLEQFAYVASHDLQEPLRMVNGFLKLLAERSAGQLDDKAREYIAYSLKGAERMSQLITDLLEFSRVDRKGRELQATDANAMLTDALANLRASIAEAGAQVTHDALPTVQADATQLGQLFQNLIGNAIKFRDPERACRVHVAAQKDGGRWVFSVRDNGIGIDPRQHARVFVIFQRLHTREEYPGTGIGLAICQRIVERHGGRIWVESQPGEGSTFFFTMPEGKMP